jgi:oligoendopeptidase F
VEIQEKLPSREEIPSKFKWRLEDIYASDALWEQDFQKLQHQIDGIQAYKGRLGESAQVLLEALQFEENLLQLNEKLYAYARMRRDEDNTNSTYQALTDRAESLSARAHAAVSFIMPEILALPEGTLSVFRQAEPGLELYGFAFDEIMRRKEHTLSVDEEKLLAQVAEVAEAPANIFKMLNNADITFEAIEGEQGTKVEVTHGRYIRLMESRDRRVRRAAFNSMYRSYRNLKNTLAAAISANVKRNIFYARVRKYSSALQAALFGDNINPEVYDNLIATVRQNNAAMHRYVKLRRNMLGLDELHMYDLYTPLVKDVEWVITYEEAVETVKKALDAPGS